MPNLNKVMLMGYLGRDPELRVTPKGQPICQFSLAINREIKAEVAGGERRSEVIFVDIEAWGKDGETIAKYLTKGKPLYVEGRLRLDTWEDKNTKEKRSRMKVVLERFQFLGSTEPGAGQHPADSPEPAAAQPSTQPPRPTAQRPAATQANLDEDVPF